MDDPLFDPWSADAEAPAPPQTPGRWRAPSEPPQPPPPRPDRMPALPVSRLTGGEPPRARLAGTPGFLRSMAVPRLQELALRLQMARHEAVVEDLLDGAPPTVFLTVRPWRGPWSDEGEPVEGRLELSLAADGQVLARSWLDGADSPPREARVVPAKLGAGWLEGTVLDFVARLLRA